MVPEREQIEAAAIISSTLLNKQMTESIHHSLGKPKLLLNIINDVNSISTSFGRCFGSPKEIINFVREPAKYYLVDFSDTHPRTPLAENHFVKKNLSRNEVYPTHFNRKFRYVVICGYPKLSGY